jgi:hypothetical protein
MTELGTLWINLGEPRWIFVSGTFYLDFYERCLEHALFLIVSIMFSCTGFQEQVCNYLREANSAHSLFLSSLLRFFREATT